MIFRRYGAHYHSVVPNFNPSAMTEVGFRRDRMRSIRADELAEAWVRVDSAEVDATADAPVQRHAERTLLATLEAALVERADGLEEGQILVVANEREDWPKTRERREGVIVDGQNRFHFHWWVSPPLRVEVWQRR